MTERTFLLDSDKTEAIRKERGLQLLLAQDLEVTPERLNAWLMGKNGIPETYLMRLCKLVSKKPLDLMSKESKAFLEQLNILSISI